MPHFLPVLCRTLRIIFQNAFSLVLAGCAHACTRLTDMWHLSKSLIGVLFVYERLRERTCGLSMCIQSCSTHALCICCAHWLPLCNVDTASRTISQGRKTVIESTLKPLGEVCKFIDLSQFDDSGEKSIKAAVSVNFKLTEQRSAARRWGWTPGLPQFLNHTCQIVKTSGSVGDELPGGVSEFCYPCAQGVGLALWGEWCMSGEELERWAERAEQLLINDKADTQRGNRGTCWRLNG